MHSSTTQTDADVLASISRHTLKAGEYVLTDGSEKLWRQVHPNNIKSGVLNNEAFVEVSQDGFVGTSSAKYEVSTSKASIVSAEEAHKHFILTHESDGTYVVTVSDVIAAHAQTVDDSANYTAEGDVAGHAYIDLRGMPKSLQRRARSHLAHIATKNQRQFPTLN